MALVAALVAVGGGAGGRGGRRRRWWLRFRLGLTRAGEITDVNSESGGLHQTAQAQRDVAALQAMALMLSDATRNGTGWTICGRQ
jgi:hypothetical protein